MNNDESESMDNELEELILGKITEFNEKIKTDEKLRKELTGETRKAQLEITDGKSYSFVLLDNQLQDFKEGTVDNPDLRFSSDKVTMLGILKKEINPLKAYMITKKLKIKASLEDMLRFRKFF
jgi:putative sterol carrier protein